VHHILVVKAGAEGCGEWRGIWRNPKSQKRDLEYPQSC
jgi:hypothetical protein